MKRIISGVTLLFISHNLICIPLANAASINYGASPFVGNSMTIAVVNRTPYSLIFTPDDISLKPYVLFTTNGDISLTDDQYKAPLLTVGPASSQCQLDEAQNSGYSCDLTQSSTVFNVTILASNSGDTQQFPSDPFSDDKRAQDLTASAYEVYRSATDFPHDANLYKEAIEALNKVHYNVTVISNDNTVIPSIKTVNPQFKLLSKYEVLKDTPETPDVDKPHFDTWNTISQAMGVASGLFWVGSVWNDRFLRPTEDRHGQSYGDRRVRGYEEWSISDFYNLTPDQIGDEEVYKNTKARLNKKYKFDGKNVRRKSTMNHLHLASAWTALASPAIPFVLGLKSYFQSVKEYRDSKNPIYEEHTYNVKTITDMSYPVHTTLHFDNADSSNDRAALYSVRKANGAKVGIYVKSAFDKGSGVFTILFDTNSENPSASNYNSAKSFDYMPGAMRSVNLPISATLMLKNSQPILQIKSGQTASNGNKLKVKIDKVNFPNLANKGVYGISERPGVNCADFGTCEIALPTLVTQKIVDDNYCLLKDATRNYKDTLVEVLYTDANPLDPDVNPPFISTADIKVDPELKAKIMHTLGINCPKLLAAAYDNENIPESQIYLDAGFTEPSDYKNWQSGQSRLDSIYLDGMLSYILNNHDDQIFLQSPNGEYRVAYDHTDGSINIMKHQCTNVQQQCRYRAFLGNVCENVCVDKVEERNTTWKWSKDATLKFASRISKVNFGPNGDIKLYDSTGSVLWSLAEKFTKPETRMCGTNRDVVPWIPDPYAKLTLTDSGKAMVYSSSSVIGYDSPYDQHAQNVIWVSHGETDWQKLK